MKNRTAIEAHSTSTIDEPWDVDANLRRLGDAPSEAQLRKMHAWHDPEGDPLARDSYRFAHHVASAGGQVGAACMKGCSSAIRSLKSGGGIPDEERSDVYSHLSRHMIDGGMEPPEMNSIGNFSWRGTDGRRYITTRTEIRAHKNDTGTEGIIEGHAAVFDSMSENLGGFFEIVRAGAFKKTIQENDIKALWNHNADVVLGRNRNDTLKLSEDRKGLAFEARMELANPAVLPVYMYIDRGDVDQCSFSFNPIRERWGSPDESGILICEQLEDRLYDISPVTFPAYPATDVAARSLLMEEFGLDLGALLGALQRQEHGVKLRDQDVAVVKRAIGVFNGLATGTPGERSHLPGATQDLAVLRRRAVLVGHTL